MVKGSVVPFSSKRCRAHVHNSQAEEARTIATPCPIQKIQCVVRCVSSPTVPLLCTLPPLPQPCVTCRDNERDRKGDTTKKPFPIFVAHTLTHASRALQNRVQCFPILQSPHPYFVSPLNLVTGGVEMPFEFTLDHRPCFLGIVKNLEYVSYGVLTGCLARGTWRNKQTIGRREAATMKQAHRGTELPPRRCCYTTTRDKTETLLITR